MILHQHRQRPPKQRRVQVRYVDAEVDGIPPQTMTLPTPRGATVEDLIRERVVEE